MPKRSGDLLTTILAVLIVGIGAATFFISLPLAVSWIALASVRVLCGPVVPLNFDTVAAGAVLFVVARLAFGSHKS